MYSTQCSVQTSLHPHPPCSQQWWGLVCHWSAHFCLSLPLPQLLPVSSLQWLGVLLWVVVIIFIFVLPLPLLSSPLPIIILIHCLIILLSYPAICHAVWWGSCPHCPASHPPLSLLLFPSHCCYCCCPISHSPPVHVILCSSSHCHHPHCHCCHCPFPCPCLVKSPFRHQPCSHSSLFPPHKKLLTVVVGVAAVMATTMVGMLGLLSSSLFPLSLVSC